MDESPKWINERPGKAQFVIRGVLAILLAAASLGVLRASEDILVADFEGTNYGSWKVAGDAFGPAPARGTLPGQMSVEGYLGQGLVNSFYHGDGTTGTLTSARFKIERRFLRFLIGGGGFPGKTCINLLVNDQVVRTATGSNTQPGGSEKLDWQQWDVSALAGNSGVIEIVDQATGGWGHINIDHILQTDRPLPAILAHATRELVLEKRYLNLPVKNHAPKHRVRLRVGGQTVREFEMELADSAPDFWVFLDLAPFQGKRAVIEVDKLRENSKALSSVEPSDQIKGAENLYHEALRPQFHFSSRRGWNNDPNGLVYYEGEYHLFYQHNPYGWDWGNMHWGHAVSTDLLHWQELPIALYPRQFDDWAFSGSAVVDRANTGGFKTGAEAPLVAAYTSTGRGECIVFSNDRGRTWTEFTGNPMVKHTGRDPRLLWHSPTRQWVMAVYDEWQEKRCIAFHTSADLKQWQFQSRIEGFYECPDFFELPVDGNPANKLWVLTAASSEYMVGDFDGQQFTPRTPKLPGHRGNAFYAAQTYSDIPAQDGRRIQIGWATIATPGMPFNQMMAFPCELTLRSTAEGPRLCFQPVRELERLHTDRRAWSALTLKPGTNVLSGIRGDLFDLRAQFKVGDQGEVRFAIRGVPVVYDAAKQELVCKDHRNPLRPVDGKVRLQILVDRTSLEIFGNDGLLYMPMAAGFSPQDQSLALTVADATVHFDTLEAYELQPVWPKQAR
jgi:fructan beta-fructosidase